MPGRSGSEENCLYLSGETLSDSSQQKRRDRLSHSSGLSSTVTSSPGGLLSDGGSSVVPSRSYRRRARRKAAAEAAKLYAPTSGFSALAPTNDITKQAVIASGPLDSQEDILLLPGFSRATVCQIDNENGCHEFFQVDHLYWEPAETVKCKYSALIPTMIPASKFPILGSASETGIPNSSLLDQEPELVFGDNLDSVDGLCDITPLQPTKPSTCVTPILGSDAQGKTSHVLKTSPIQFPPMDSGESGIRAFTHALGPGKIDPAARSLNSSDVVIASPKAMKEAQRIAKNRRIFGWVDDVASSVADTPESISTTSSSLLVSLATEDSLDLGSALLIDGSSPNNPATQPSVSSRQLTTYSAGRISPLDLDYAGASVSPGFIRCPASSISTSSPSELLLLDFEDGIQSPTLAKDGNLPLPNPPELPSTHAPSPPAPVPINIIPAPVGDASPVKATSEELQRKPTVVKVVVSAPKKAKEVPPPILGPIISAADGSNPEVGNAAWSRWVEENSELAHGALLSRNTQRQSPRSQNTRRWSSFAPKNGKRVVYTGISLRQRGSPNGGSYTAIRDSRDRENDPSGPGDYIRFGGHGGSLFKGQVETMVGSHQGHPIRAILPPAVKPASAPSAADVAPVTWAGSGLPFEGLASRRGVTAPLATLGYHNPQTASYKRTSAFNREQKVRQQVYGKRALPPPPKAFKTFPTKLDVWASQEADFMRSSGP